MLIAQYESKSNGDCRAKFHACPFNNKQRLLAILSDTCSYIDRLGVGRQPRPRKHPFEAGMKFNPLSLFACRYGLTFGSLRGEFSFDQGNTPPLQAIYVPSRGWVFRCAALRVGDTLAT